MSSTVPGPIQDRAPTGPWDIKPDIEVQTVAEWPKLTALAAVVAVSTLCWGGLIALAVKLVG